MGRTEPSTAPRSSAASPRSRGCASSLTVPAAAATTRTVSGTVFWDQDDDGSRDPGEPGVAGIRVHSNAANGLPTTTTDAAGTYSLAGLSATGAGALTVETGWFRSQCAALSCAAGPGPGQRLPDGEPVHQAVPRRLTADRDRPGRRAAAGLAGPAARQPPAPVAGVVPANAVDVAARLSWATSTCAQGTLNICSCDDTYTASGQIHNQGRTALTGVNAVLALPPGDAFAGGDPLTAVAMTTTATSPGITGLTVHGYDAVHRAVLLSFQGTLVAGGLIKVTVKGTVVGGPGTPGCTLTSPASTCAKAEPQGAPLLLAVTGIDQAGDPDSFGPGCAALVDVTRCPTGIHDKQVEPDEVDGVGHNVVASLDPATSFDLVGRVDRLAGTGTTAGSHQTVRVSVLNAGPTMVVPGWVSTTLFPKGSAPALPVGNAARTCTKSTTSGYPVVRCTGKAPLSPGVTSFAIDIPWTVPTTSRSGTTLRVLTFVQPTGQSGETVPMGALPTSPGDAATTATDNDASVDLVVG